MNQERPVLEAPGRAFLVATEAATASRFSQHRYELPLLSVFLRLALLELMVVHMLVSMWSLTAAWVLTALSILAVVQIAAIIHGLVRYPTEIDAGQVHVRHGRAGRILVPLTAIERVDNVAFAPEEKGREVFRATLIASPNVALRLREPVIVRRRPISTITLRLDEPAAFMVELEARKGKGSRRE
jgi:hypothetical protein